MKKLVSEGAEREKRREKEERKSSRLSMDPDTGSSNNRDVPKVGSLTGSLDSKRVGDPNVLEGNGRVLSREREGVSGEGLRPENKTRRDGRLRSLSSQAL